MTLKLILSIVATLAVVYAAWGFVRELHAGRETRLGALDSSIMLVWALSAALLPWVGEDFLPWLPRVGLVLTAAAVSVGLIALRQFVRAHRAESDA